MALATVRAFGGRTRRPALRNGFLNLGAIDLPCPFFFLILPISIIQGAKHPEMIFVVQRPGIFRMLRPYHRQRQYNRKRPYLHLEDNRSLKPEYPLRMGYPVGHPAVGAIA